MFIILISLNYLIYMIFRPERRSGLTVILLIILLYLPGIHLAICLTYETLRNILAFKNIHNSAESLVINNSFIDMVIF